MLKVTVTHSGFKEDGFLDKIKADVKSAVMSGYETAQANNKVEALLNTGETKQPNESVLVTMEEIPNGYSIALGQNGAFIEFGAGDTTSPNEYAQNAPFEVSPGSFSRQNAGIYERYKHWHYGKIDYKGIYPNRPLFKAMQTIKQELQSKGYDVK